MPTFNDPVADADELREAVRGLAHATRSIDDPTAIYPVLGLHQLGARVAEPVAAPARRLPRRADAQAGVDERRPACRPRCVVPGLLGAASRGRDGPSGRRVRRPGARGRGDHRLRHRGLPVARPGPPAARRIAGCRCDRLAGRPAPLGRPRLPRARASAGPRSCARPPPEPGCREDREAGVPRRSGRPTNSPPRSARPSPSRGLASPARQRSARPAGSGSRGIRTPRRPSPAPTRSSPKAVSAAKASSSARTSTPAARSSTTRGCSTPAA